MTAKVHRLEAGYKPDGKEVEREALRRKAADLVRRYDELTHYMLDIYRLIRDVSGEPVR